MYTWDYIRKSCLAKLDLGDKEAEEQNLLNRFYVYANEVITQISSSVKPKLSYAEVNVTDVPVVVDLKTITNDFISFGNDRNLVERQICGKTHVFVSNDEDFIYRGNSSIYFLKPGKYSISYNARWYTFSSSTPVNTEIDVPEDILDCIPSYVASQCYKIDDDYKSSVFRNEYEMFLARIDNTDFRDTTTFTIGGDW